MKNLNAGYTLVELLVVIALTGLVFTIAGTAIFQISTTTGYGNDRLTVLHETQNAAYWFIRDGQEAVSASGGNTLTLTLADHQEVVYNLTGTTLQRSSGSSVRPLLRGVSSISFSVLDRLISMDYTSSSGGRWSESVQRSYQVSMRALP